MQKEKISNPLEKLSDEEILQLLNVGPYSANVRWEAIKRKISKGEYDPGQSGKDSLYMLNRLAFFSELNKNSPSHQTALEISNHKKQELKDTRLEEVFSVLESETQSVSLSAQVDENLPIEEGSNFSVADAENQETAKPLQFEEIKRKKPHESFKASPFLSWIKTFDDSEGKEVKVAPAAKVDKIVFDFEISEESEEIQPKIKKNKKGKKSKKDKSKNDLVEEYLVLNPEIASETLADLLASQGHIQEANEMYRQLGIKYPKKSSYFASKLKKS